MPYFVIQTNLKSDKFPVNWLQDATSLIARILQKPERFVCIRCHSDQEMVVGHNTDTQAIMRLTSIGKISEAENRSHATEIADFIENTLQIPKSRQVVTFCNATRDMFAWNGKLFSDGKR